MAPSPTEKKDAEAVRDYSAAWTAIMRLARAGSSWSGRERHCAFLNCGDVEQGARFANVSAVSGLDFPDDGRALAVTDWDGDGDLDLWARNRNAPRLRMLRNNTSTDDPGAQNWIALRLEGRKVNRDAIGARAEVVLADGTRLQETVHAGTGFLSQSSKWLHFGLGSGAPEIRLVRVRWPGGNSETFVGIANKRRHRLTEGAGKAELLPPRSGVADHAASNQEPLPASGAAQIILPGRIPLPTMTFHPAGASAPVPLQEGSRPLLLLIFSGHCGTCRTEMTEFTAEAQAIRDAGLEILALSLDSLAPGGDADGAAAKLIQETEFPFLTGSVTVASAGRIRHLLGSLFDYPPPFSVPLGLLLDAKRNIVSIYRGPVALETLVHDLRHGVGGHIDSLRDLAIPFPGRWHTKSITESELAEFVAKYFHSYDPAERLRYLEIASTSALNSNRAAKLRRQVIDGHLAWARDYSSGGKVDQATFHFEKTLQLDSENGLAHNDFGALLANQGKLAEAEIHFRHALVIDPDDALAKRNLKLLTQLRNK